MPAGASSITKHCSGRHTDPLGGGEVRLRVWLPLAQLVGGDEDRRCLQSRRPQPSFRHRGRAAGDDRQPIGRHRPEQRRSARQGSAACGVRRLERLEFFRERVHVRTRHQIGDQGTRRPTVRDRQDSSRVQSVGVGEFGPVLLHRSCRVDQHPIEVTQHRRRLAHVHRGQPPAPLRTGGLEPDRTAFVVRASLRVALAIAFRPVDADQQRAICQALDQPCAPFDRSNGSLHVQVEILHLLEAAEPVGIDVQQRQPPVPMLASQDESRARHRDRSPRARSPAPE